MMELSSRPRHQIRAQGRRRGHAGVVIVEQETSRLRWHPGSQRSVAVSVVPQTERTSQSRNSLEILEFISRTAVQSERELLSTLDEPTIDVSSDRDPSQSVQEFRRILTSVQRNNRSAFRRNDGSEPTYAQKDRELLFAPDDDTFSNEENDEHTAANESGQALRSLLNELNAWLSASNLAKGDSSSSTIYEADHGSPAALVDNAAQRDLARLKSRFGFEQAKDWTYGVFDGNAESVRVAESRNKLSPFFDAARRMVVGVRSLPLGRRLESHENGAVLEKDELGRVTQIRSASGEIISVYYGKDGAAEGFVRTDSKGKLHSVAECDGNGVVLRDQSGRVRAQGESLCIDPLGRISICRADGQYWSIDLARQMLSEKRRLADPSGRWNALTAVFAADGFRMMTLFQKLSPDVDKKVSSPADANRIWSTASVEKGSFRFYGRDGSTIEFDSEESLANLAPANVSSPAVRPIEPCWQAKHQAGTAWQSVHEYVVSYLAV
ncbi:MAG TPA: hypothetical protein V6C86_19420 [Oculatellaceae cyanobacterium]